MIVLTTVAGPAGGLTLRFEAQPGLVYRVQSLAALGNSNWQTLHEFPASAAVTTLEFTDAGGGGVRYYRIITAGGR